MYSLGLSPVFNIFDFYIDCHFYSNSVMDILWIQQDVYDDVHYITIYFINEYIVSYSAMLMCDKLYHHDNTVIICMIGQCVVLASPIETDHYCGLTCRPDV